MRKIIVVFERLLLFNRRKIVVINILRRRKVKFFIIYVFRGRIRNNKLSGAAARTGKFKVRRKIKSIK